jgi:hypothetical protein
MRKKFGDAKLSANLPAKVILFGNPQAAARTGHKTVRNRGEA